MMHFTPVNIGDDLLFPAVDSVSGTNLWSTSDPSGTDATRLTDIDTYPRALTDVDGRAMFFIERGDFPRSAELWASAGTVETTEPIALFHDDAPYGVELGTPIAVGNKLYFTVATHYFYDEYYEYEEDWLEAYDSAEDLANDWGEWTPTEL